jgi:AcrR family transcriptional regulator
VSAVRPPKQRRSRESYERVLDAAYRLLEENGFEGATVQEVATRSGVSVGAIYERFGNKETLLRAVHARLMDEMTPSLEGLEEAGLEFEDAHEAIGAAVAAVARSMSGHRKALRAFMHLGAVDEVISARGSEASIALSQVFKRTVVPFRDEIAHPRPEIALDVAYRMTYSTLARQVMYGPVFESDRRLGWRRLIDELTNACVAYLLG